ncbi:MAG: hypothetical protein ACNA78_03700 [Balneolaceae bacterium]
MFGNKSHKINILETPFSTISSGGHWFFATRKSIEEYVPGILEKISFEKLIRRAVHWVDSADSLSMLLYFVLAFSLSPWLAAFLTLLFHGWWYFTKSAFVNLPTTPLIGFLNNDLVQVGVAGVALSFMGINGMYFALVIGIVYFFLFKIGILRRGWDRLDKKRDSDKLPLNDRVLKMLLVRYSMYENIAPSDVQRLEKHVQDAVIKYHSKK